MTTSPADDRRGTLLVGFDGSAEARQAVRWSAAEAVARNCPLLVVHCFERFAPHLSWTPVMPPPQAAGTMAFPDLDAEHIRRVADNRLTETIESCQLEWQGQGLDVTGAVVDGDPVTALPEIAAELDTPFVVLGASGTGALSRTFLGSTAAELVRVNQRPTIVVRGQHAGIGHKPVVAGTDGSEASERALIFAFEFAAQHQVPLRVVHAWSDRPLDPWAEKELLTAPHIDDHDTYEAITGDAVEQQVRLLKEHYPAVPVSRHNVADRPAHALVAQAADSGLMVVGSHGRGALRRLLLGSVSQAVLYHSPCPVAVVTGARSGNHGSDQ